MAEKNQIGLDAAQARTLADKLNVLLANFQVFYINARGFHWNITGDKFFELHAKFEELYTYLINKVDEVAERILTLDHSPAHHFSLYLKTSSIPEVTNVSQGKEAIENIVDGFGALLKVEREILSLSTAAGDEGTTSLMSDYIREQEKQVWMYSAYLKSPTV